MIESSPINPPGSALVLGAALLMVFGVALGNFASLTAVAPGQIRSAVVKLDNCMLRTRNETFAIVRCLPGALQ